MKNLQSFKMLILFFILPGFVYAQQVDFEYEETTKLVKLVDDAVNLIEEKGEAAFKDLEKSNSAWIDDEKYVFVLDLDGLLVVHPDEKMVGKNQITLKDINGKPFIRWFIYEVTGSTDFGWSHYLWVKPNQIFPTWKSTYVKLATTEDGNKYVVGSGLYNMKMEKAFVIDAVNDAAELLKRQGEAAFDILRDIKSEFIFMNTYVFVMDMTGTILVLPPFPNIEKTNLYNYTDINGKYVTRDMIKLMEDRGSGWCEYMWPKPGESTPSKKISFLKKIITWEDTYILGIGLYTE